MEAAAVTKVFSFPLLLSVPNRLVTRSGQRSLSSLSISMMLWICSDVFVPRLRRETKEDAAVV